MSFVMPSWGNSAEWSFKAGSFREDLYYRINVIRLPLPPLRERREDIPLLVESFVQKFNERFGRKIATLIAYDWPGNVRELQNCVENLVVKAKHDVVDFATLPPHLLTKTTEGAVHFQVGMPMEEVEMEMIRLTLAARMLKIGLRTLQRKIKKFRLP